VQINLLGTVNVMHAAFRQMYKQGCGRLLVSTSVAGLCGEHGLPAYSASKAALIGLMHALHLEGHCKGIFVNSIAPYAATQMTEAHLAPALTESMAAETVAPVAAWLVSDSCPLSDEIVIAGAGKIARAKMHESRSIRIESDGIASAWQRLDPTTSRELAAGANAHFRRFINDAVSP
jgi:NAD(P)-dependent dehydrogenase (short-subunit alcohol dehydrogenase family)